MLRIILLILLQGVVSNSSVATAAAKFQPGIQWRQNSVIKGDFSCQGRQQQAILGTTPSEIVIAIFLNGTNQQPEVLRYSGRARHAASAELIIEGQDFDAKMDTGYVLPGFKRSSTCKGFRLSDGLVDSAHIYWNHDAKRFDDWVR